MKKKTNLYVGNLPSTATENELREVFASFGHIKSLVVMPNRAGDAQ